VEEIWLGLVKLGVPAMLGGLFDYGFMYSGQRRRLRELLADSWIRLSYVQWPTFGRGEAVAATRAIDRIAGAKLLSKKRFLFVTIVGAGAITVSFVIVVGLSYLRKVGVQFAVYDTISASVQVIIAILSLGVSVSLSQRISRAVLAVPERFSTLAFFAMGSVQNLSHFGRWPALVKRSMRCAA
jgi:hypothetical protein